MKQHADGAAKQNKLENMENQDTNVQWTKQYNGPVKSHGAKTSIYANRGGIEMDNS